MTVATKTADHHEAVHWQRGHDEHPEKDCPVCYPEPDCYIDGCTNKATYIREDHPDDVTLCADHRGLRAEGE